MMFEPHIPRIVGPRLLGGAGMSGAPSTAPAISAVFPISRLCDLSIIPVAGVQDYFLYHPYDGSIQDVLVGAESRLALTDFSLQLVQTSEGATVTFGSTTQIDELNVDPISIAVPGSLSEGPVFLRVTSAAVSANLLVTLHVMTSEVQ